MKQSTNFTSEMMKKGVKAILMIVLLNMGTLSGWAQSGDFGEDGALHWEITGFMGETLLISGTGDMPDDSFDNWSMYAQNISNVIIGAGVTSIGNDAFNVFGGGPLGQGFISLTNVIIPNSVTRIGDGAFAGCVSLEYVSFPYYLKSIGNGAFRNSGLRVINNLGNAMMDTMIIEFGAFADCSNLTSVTINSVTSIGDYAFAYCPNLKNIALVNVETIGDYAFAGCSVASLTIPESVTNIGNYAFYDCSSLTSLTINDGVKSIGNGYGIFERCIGLTSVTIPESVTSIGSGAFSDCKGLTSFTIGSGVKNIGYSAFVNCAGLTSLTIPEGVTSIGGNAFSGCKGLTSIDIPASVTSTIEQMTFYKCTNLTSVTIGRGVTNIEFGAFMACDALLSIEVDNANPSYSSKDGVLFDKGKTTLVLCPCGKSGSYAIPSGVINFGLGAFGGSLLTSVIIPKSVRTIGMQAFQQCYGLISVTILEGVTSIENNAFSACTGLTSVAIPSSVTGIDFNAFAECKNLTSVTNFKSTPQVIVSSVFRNIKNAATLYVPAGSKSAYMGAPVWQNFSTIIELSYSPVSQPYPNIMNFTVAISLDGDEIQSGNLEIGAFCGNECRGTAVLQNIPGASQQSNSQGSAALQYAPAATQHSFLGFLSVYGNGNEDITFKVFDHDTGKEYEATIAPVTFTVDAMSGTLEDPYLITIASPTGTPNVQSGSVAVYLDSSGEKLNILHPWNIIDRLEIVDLNGRIIRQETGFVSEYVNISTLAQGMYILKLIKDNQVSVYKFVKK